MGKGFKKGNDANAVANRLRGLESCERDLACMKELLGETISERDELRIEVSVERRKVLSASKKLEKMENINVSLRDLLRVSNASMGMMRAPAEDAPVAPSALSGGLEAPPALSGGLEMGEPGPPPKKRRLTGNATKENNVRRWVIEIKGIINARFGPEQFVAVVRSLYSELVSEGDGSVIRELLLHMSHSEVDDVLSLAYILSREKLGQQRFADAFQEHLSTAVCLDLKTGAPLSRKKYDAARKLISRKWIRDEGAWVRTYTFLSLPFPCLAFLILASAARSLSVHRRCDSHSTGCCSRSWRRGTKLISLSRR
jgi:hypothetical protein